MDECNDKKDVEMGVQQVRIERVELRRIYSQLFHHPRNNMPGPTNPGGGFAYLKSVGGQVKSKNEGEVNKLLQEYHDRVKPKVPSNIVLDTSQWECLVKTFTDSELKVLRTIEGTPSQPVGGKLKVGPYELAFLYYCLFHSKGGNDEMHEALHRMKYSVVTGGDYFTVISDELTRVYNDHSPAGELVMLDFDGTGIIKAMAKILKDPGFKNLEPYEGDPCKDKTCY